MATSASAARTNNPEIDGLLVGTRWSGTITYSLPDSPSDYATNYLGHGEPTTAGFSSAPFAMQQAIVYAVGLISGYTNATIQYAGTNGADITVAQSPAANPTSYAYYPANGPAGGDVWFGTGYDYSQAALGNYYFATALHELGHAVGLKHSQETGGVANVAVPAAHDNSEFTIMSYRSYVGGPLTGYTNETYGFPQTYMANDILALQTLYGANYNTHSENTVYSWNSETGQQFINGIAQPAPGTGAGGSSNRIFETIWDGNGIDTYDLSNYTTDVTLNLNPGASSITSAAQIVYLGNGHYAQGNVYNAYLFNNDPRSYIDNAIGGSGNDTLIGNAIANTLHGLGGNDTLDGGAGADLLVGGVGDDIYVIDNAGDIGIESANEGTDTVRVAALAAYTLGGNLENLTNTGRTDFTGIGNALGNVIIGGAGNDRLLGDGGNDILIDGIGSNTLQGGTGDDIYIVQSNTDSVFEFANEGIDQVRTFLSFYLLFANFENLTFVGPAAHTGIGNELNNVLIGGAGDDFLLGLDGDDVLVDGSGVNMLQGGPGNDLYVVQSIDEAVYEEEARGIDQVSTFLSFYQLPANFENLTFVGSAAHTGVGNELNNVLIGGAGNDYLLGLGGDDVLIDGIGSNFMQGSLGDDHYVVQSIDEAVYEDANEGIDRVSTFLSSYTLTANVENLRFAANIAHSGIGNALNNTLTGAGGNDTLDGLVGADTMIGGLGNDTYVVDNAGDVVVEAAGEGSDTVQVGAIASYTLAANVENMTHTASNTFTGTGDGLANVMTGGTGADTLNGGGGNDTYIVNSSSTVIGENLNDGTDTVQVGSLADYVLSANVENLTHTGSNSFVGIGNGLANVLIGGAGNDYLLGLGGDDVLIDGNGVNMLQGGLGNDLYVVQSINEAVYEDANEGIDQVSTFLSSYTLSANVENLTFVSDVAHTGIGNALNNTLTGAAGNDYLIGLGGDDVLVDGRGFNMLQGGLGNDLYVVQSINEAVYEDANEGIDQVNTFLSSHTLSDNVENLTFVADVAHAGNGNGLDNVIVGAGANDALNGGAGADTLVGGGGNDTLTGGTGADQFVFSTALSAADNVDTITDFTAGSDHIVLDDAIFSALSAGSLNAAAFSSGAVDANTRVIYNESTGALSYDADGSGARAAVQFAALAAHLSLTSNDFLIA